MIDLEALTYTRLVESDMHLFITNTDERRFFEDLSVVINVLGKKVSVKNFNELLLSSEIVLHDGSIANIRDVREMLESLRQCIENRNSSLISKLEETIHGKDYPVYGLSLEKFSYIGYDDYLDIYISLWIYPYGNVDHRISRVPVLIAFTLPIIYSITRYGRKYAVALFDINNLCDRLVSLSSHVLLQMSNMLNRLSGERVLHEIISPYRSGYLFPFKNYLEIYCHSRSSFERYVVPYTFYNSTVVRRRCTAHILTEELMSVYNICAVSRHGVVHSRSSADIDVIGRDEKYRSLAYIAHDTIHEMIKLYDHVIQWVSTMYINMMESLERMYELI